MGRAARLAVFLLLAVLLLAPTWMMIANSFSPAQGFLRHPPRLFPYRWTLENYHRVVSLPLLSRWILNTFALAVLLIGAGILVNGTAGYVFCFGRFRWLKALFWLMMTPIFVSRYVLIISQFVVVGKLGLTGILAVLSMSLLWSTGIFLFRNYFRSIPLSLVESARLDGATEWQVFCRVVLPLSKPILGVAIVFLGMGALGDYIWQMLNLQAARSQTYLVGLMASTLTAALHVRSIGYDLAVGTMLFLPYLALFSFSSRYFIAGLTGGAIKE